MTSGDVDSMKDQLDQRVVGLLYDFTHTIAYDTIVTEFRMIQDYKTAWKAAPYAPTFVTTDAVVVQSGHLLLVKRKHAPGMGLWALPGGFLNQEETLEAGMLRELREETKIKVPLPVLRGSIKSQKTFDHPNRSTRGRTITTAFFIDLGFDNALPKVKGSDDAEVAVWVPFNKIDRTQMFEDHFAIIDNFINIG
jgi:bifunctional NMN adenylyltransferase/nudix hydrolase